MISPFLLSLLGRQLALLGDRFDTRYPHAWLVWEASERLAPQTPEAQEVGATQFPPTVRSRQPVGGDGLCFPLVLPAEPHRKLSAGRASSNDIVIEEMSVSREHLKLFVREQAWYVEVPPSPSIATFVRRISLQPGEPVQLVNGCRIEAGGVALTFYERGRFRERLVVENSR